MSRKTEKELAKEVFDNRREPGAWSDEAEVIEARPSRTAVVSCRLPLEEFEVLLQAAQEAGETLSDYVRTAIALRRQGGVPPSGIRTSSFGAHVHVISNLPALGSWSDAPQSQDRTI